jgi:hypothetical protein
LTPEAILDAITTGPMTVNAEGMSPAQKRILAEHLALRPLGSTTSGSVSAMPNHCSPKPLGIERGRGGAVGEWIQTPRSWRRLPVDRVRRARLKLKWAFGFQARCRRSLSLRAGGRLFVGSDGGYLYTRPGGPVACRSFQAWLVFARRQHRIDRRRRRRDLLAT